MAATFPKVAQLKNVTSFRERDSQLLHEQHAIHDSEELLIQSSKDTAAELEALLRRDKPKR